MQPASPTTPEPLARSAAKAATSAPNIDGLPPRLTRRAAADALRDRLGFYVSPRTLGSLAASLAPRERQGGRRHPRDLR